MKEKYWRRNHRGEIGGGKILKEKPWRRGYGGEAMKETSWSSNPGGHLEAEVPRSHPEAPQGLPRRHPGTTQEPPRRRPEAPRKHPETPGSPPGSQRGLQGKIAKKQMSFTAKTTWASKFACTGAT